MKLNVDAFVDVDGQPLLLVMPKVVNRGGSS